MDITLPALPAGVLVLLAFFAPYAQALIQRPEWPTAWRKIITLVVALALTAVVLVLYYAITGDVIPSWPVFLLLAISVASASYALVTKTTAKKLEAATSPGDDQN